VSEINPEHTLVVILGASEFHKAPKLAAGRAFYNSAFDLREYFTDKDCLGVPPQNIRWLFDDSRSPTDQLEDIAAFLQKRISELKHGEDQARDFILYYVGHGLFERGGQAYCLAVRSTNENNEGPTSIRAHDLAAVLMDNASFLRKFLILDCCFSSAAYKEFQSGPLHVARAKLQEELPLRGTSLLCSSSAQDASLAPSKLSHTMFSDALIKSLRQGDPSLGPSFSVSELGALIKQYLRNEYQNSWVRPEVHSPDQREGNIADLAIFPNLAYQAASTEQSKADRFKQARKQPKTEEVKPSAGVAQPPSTGRLRAGRKILVATPWLRIGLSVTLPMLVLAIGLTIYQNPIGSPAPSPGPLNSQPEKPKSINGGSDVGGLGPPFTKGFYVPDLGVRIMFLTKELSNSTLGLASAGAWVLEVESERPAGKNGIQAGDLIVSIGGRNIETEDDLRQAVRNLHTGKTAFTIRRGSDLKKLIVDCPNCK
jgi:hypothetical protein